MVAVSMGKDDSVDPLHLLTQHLLPEVRTGVDNKILIVDLNKNGGAQSLVTEVDGPAYFAHAANHWHTL
jgi:hypothetical protein